MTVVGFLECKARRSDAKRITYAKAETALVKCFNVDSPDIIVERIRTHTVNPYDAIDKFVSWLLAKRSARKQSSPTYQL